MKRHLHVLLVENDDEAKLVLKLALSSAANYNSGHSLFLLETFQMYLTMSLLFGKNLKMLPKTNIFIFYLPLNQDSSKENNSVTQHKLQYNTGVTMQDNVAQHW